MGSGIDRLDQLLNNPATVAQPVRPTAPTQPATPQLSGVDRLDQLVGRYDRATPAPAVTPATVNTVTPAPAKTPSLADATNLQETRDALERQYNDALAANGGQPSTQSDALMKQMLNLDKWLDQQHSNGGYEDNVVNMFRGAGEGTARGYVGAARFLHEAQGQVYAGQQRNIAQYLEDTGSPGAEFMRANANQFLADRANETAKLAATSDRLADQSAQHIEQAKEGLGTVGRTLVDVGVAGTQMLGDAAGNLIMPGGGLALMGIRSFGSASEDARRRGADLGRQFAYALPVAATEVITEKLFDGLAGVFGKGAADKAVEGLIAKAVKSKPLQNALRALYSMGGEAFEEAISGIVDPLLENIIDGRKGEGFFRNLTPDAVADLGYSALIGGILGGIGGSVDIMKNPDLSAKIAVEQAQEAAGQQMVADARNAYAQAQGASQATPNTTPAENAVQSDAGASNATQPTDALAQVIMDIQRSGAEKATKAQVEAVMNDAASMQRLGVEPATAENGKTASQVRGEVKDALAQAIVESQKPASNLNTTAAQNAEVTANATPAAPPTASANTGFHDSTGVVGKSASAILDKLAKMTRTSIEIDPNVDDVVNGQIIGNRIILQKASDLELIKTGKHEITHRLQELSPEAYTTYRDYAVNALAEKGDVDALIARYQQTYAQVGQNLTTDQAKDEIAADFTEALVTEAEKGSTESFEKLAAHDAKAAKGFVQAIRDFIAKVKALFSGKKAAQDEVSRATFGVELDKLDQAAKLWDSLLNEGAQAAQELDVDTTENVATTSEETTAHTESEETKATEATDATENTEAEQTERNKRYSHKVNLGTFFSGGGLVDYALRKAAESTMAVELDEKAAAVFELNNGKVFNGDVRDFSKQYLDDMRGKVDYFHASPVCKNYSRMNIRRSVKADNNVDITTAKATADAIGKLMPQVFTLEQVPGYQGSAALKIITDKLDALGYKVDTTIAKASDYGGATSRERLMLRAVKDGDLPPLPEKSGGYSWYEATSDMLDKLPEAELSNHLKEKINITQDLRDAMKNANSPILILGGTPGGKVWWAPSNQPCPSITTKMDEARVLMPDGRVLRATPRFFARIMGLPDSYQFTQWRGKDNQTTAYKVIGNGVPVQLTQAFFGNLLDAKLDTGVRYSPGLDESVSGVAYDTPAPAYNGNNTAVIDADNGKRYSLKSAREDLNDFNWDTFSKGKMYKDMSTIMSDKDIHALFDGIKDLVEYMTPNRDILDMNEETNKGDRKFKPYKPNSDPLYKVSLDFSTLCRKRLMTQFVIEQLQLRENRALSAEEQLTVRNMLIDYRAQDKALQVACAMCYVEAARLKSPKFINGYLENPEPVIVDYLAKKSKSFAATIRNKQADFKEAHGYARNAAKKDMSAADVKELNRLTPQWRQEYTPSAEEQRIIELAKTLPNSTYLTAKNLADLASGTPAEQTIYGAYTNYIREMTHSKGLETGVAYYYGDSKKVSAKRLAGFNAENGLRFDSWSDFQFEHMLDMMMAVIDLSTRKVGNSRGAKMHGYTKFPEMVRIFGKTGMMFNLSGVSEGDGFNEDGSLRFSKNESVDYDEAIKVRDEFPETAGLQCIGINDKHIRALMASKLIDYIIPYHRSGMNALLRKMAGIDGWTDYEGTQEASIDKNIKFDPEKHDEKTWHKEPVFSEFFVGYDTGMSGIEAMRASAENYKRMCAERGMKPKFEKFADDENFWKLLIDRKMINQKTGALIEQKAVRPDFDFGAIKKEIDKYVANYDPELQNRALDYITKNWKADPVEQASVLGNEMLSAQQDGVEGARDSLKNNPLETMWEPGTTRGNVKTSSTNDALVSAVTSKVVTPRGTGAASKGFNQSAGPQVQTQNKTVTEGVAYSDGQKRMVAPGTHERISEGESMSRAAQGFYEDSDGNVDIDRTAQDLLDDDHWTGVMNDRAMLVQQMAIERATETGRGWNLVRKMAAKIEKMGTVAGQSLQARKKWIADSGDNIVTAAASLLEQAADKMQEGKLRRGVNPDEVLTDISVLASQYQSAIDRNDAAALVDIIRRTAQHRHTTGLFRGDLSRSMNKALDYVVKQGDIDFLRNFAANGIYAVASDSLKTDAGTAIVSARRMAMLSKASTILRNLIGNGTFDIADTTSNNISVPLDVLLSALTGTRSVAGEAYVSKAKVKGNMDGFWKSLLEVGLDVDTDGQMGKYETGGKRTFRMASPTARLLSTMEKWQGYAMTTTDETAKGGIRAETQRGIDRLTARGRVKDDSLVDAAQQTALRRTFQDETAASKLALDARRALNNLHLGKIGLEKIRAGDFAIPFAQVPANLTARAVDYSPIGLANGIVETVRVLKKAHDGTLTAAQQRQAVLDLGAGINGTALIAGAAALALKGVLKVKGVLGGDDDKEALDAQGGQSGTQLNVDAVLRWAKGEDTGWRDGDTLVSIGFLDPINAMLATGALIAADLKDEDGANVGSILKDSLNGTLTSVMELPVMETLRNFVEDMSRSKENTEGGKFTDALEQFLADQVTSLIPNAVKGIAQGRDEYQRNAYTKKDLAGQTLDAIKASIPGLRETLPVKQDSYGRDMMTEEDPLWRALNANIMPGKVTKMREDALTTELNRLNEETGENGFYPNKKAPATLSSDGVETMLSPEQQRKYQAEAGGIQLATGTAVMGLPSYRNAPAGMQVEIMDCVRDYSHQLAKNSVVGADLDRWVQNAKNSQRDLHMSTAEWLTQYQLLGGSEGLFGSSRYSKTLAMVKDGGLTLTEWGSMYRWLDNHGSGADGSVVKDDVVDYITDHFAADERAQVFDAYKGSRTWNNPF